MKSANQFYQSRSFWLSGAAGFVFAALLSLVGGNLAVTSLQRGLAGMLAAMVLFWIFARFYQSMKNVLDNRNVDSTQTNTTGTKFDVSLPAESPLDSPQASDFEPWMIAQPPTITDEQAKQMAETLREMKK